VYLQRDKLDEAHASFERALELYRQAHSVLGEANSLQRLGDVCLQQDNLQEAELCLNHALLLHQQFQVPSLHATDLRLLEQLSVRKKQPSK
jgi:tetratricopeptide (TPR) repeat protein